MILGFLDRFRDYGPLCLRAVLGVVMMAHGSQKLFGAFGGSGLSGTAGFFDQIGLRPGLFWATVAAVVETFGGLLVFVGFLTRPASVLIAITMFVAMVRVHLPNGFFLKDQGIEFALVLFTMATALVFLGPGALAAEGKATKR
jgi:putative oxidoreductase